MKTKFQKNAFELIQQNKYLLALALVIFLFIGCDIAKPKLLLINNTDKGYYYSLILDATDLKQELNIQHVSARDSVRPLLVNGGDGAWEYSINHYSPDSTLSIYLFDNDKIKISEIENSKIKKLTYTVKDLENLKWKIVIPE